MKHSSIETRNNTNISTNKQKITNPFRYIKQNLKCPSFDHDRFYHCGFFVFSGGIFLLLGYSSMDEELLRAYTNLGIQDTIRAFQQYIYNHIDNQVRIE